MKVYLALSCLQGRPMQQAAEELIKLSGFNLQLTPGNVPTLDFEKWLNDNQIKYLTHHGFSFNSMKQKVWNDSGEFIVKSASVHPPKNNVDYKKWWKYISDNYQTLPILEVMYDDYLLGNGDDIEKAMDMGINLVVDISHIYIQKVNNKISDKIWNKLQNYENIKEIHISANNGKIDSHKPIDKNTFGLEWAKERSRNTNLVLECYMHKLSFNQRLEQLNFLDV